MISLLWAREIHGSVEHSDAECVITAPRFGDGNWRGGWWALYDHGSGAQLWRRHHRRGASLFAISDDMIIATTHKGSGIYGISRTTGKKIWSRLGYLFNYLLKAVEYLPVDNEGDCPRYMLGPDVLADSGRLLDSKTGKVKSRHHIEWGKYPDCGLKSIDGKPAQDFLDPRYRYGGISHKPHHPESLIPVLENLGLQEGGPQSCCIRHGRYYVVLACPITEEYRFSSGPLDVPHSLLIIRQADHEIVYREELDSCYYAEIAWCDRETLAITLQTVKQWNWTYRRHVRVYKISGL